MVVPPRASLTPIASFAASPPTSLPTQYNDHEIVLPMSSLSAKQIFNEFTELPGDLIPAQSQVKDLAVRFVESTDESNDRFDWAGFKGVLDCQNAEDIVLNGFVNSPISLQGDDVSVSTMVGKVMDLLPSLLPKQPVDQSEMKEELDSSLVDLDRLWDESNQASTAGVLSEKRLSREYRVIVGVPSSRPNYLISVVATVTVDGYFKKESTWGGLGRPKITKELKAAVKVMELLVAQGFTHPSS